MEIVFKIFDMDPLTLILNVAAPFWSFIVCSCVLQIDLLTSIEALYRFVDKDHLPVPMGGTLQHRHDHWVAFRLVSGEKNRKNFCLRQSGVKSKRWSLSLSPSLSTLHWGPPQL